MNKRPMSTYDRIMQDPKRRKAYQKEYKEFILSELLLALMENDGISIRKLAKAAGISPGVIQDIRSGKQKDIRLTKFKNIVQTFGYSLILEKDGTRIPIG